MGCCKCEEHNWHDPQEVVWKDPADGKEYCVFHAPKEEKKTKQGKRITVGEFNMLFFKEMERQHNVGVDPLCSMQGVIFPGAIDFKKFLKDKPLFSLCLQQAEFCGEAIFYDLVIEGITLDEAIFHAGADFSGSKLVGRLSLYGAKFCGKTHFAKSEFEFGALFIAAEFEAPVWFSETRFCGKALFHAIKAGESQVRMQGISCTSLSNVNFSSLEAKMFSFTGCSVWPEDFGYESSKETNDKALEELYRAMKQRASENHDQPQVSHWHYREKLMALKRGGNGIFEAVMLWLYWATSGFGERAVRAGVWLLALVALSFALNATPQPLDWNSLWGAAAANATLASIPFAKDIPGDGWVKVMRGVWQFLIAVQFTLFALAVRNRFRR
jgi:hypothetical protein